MTENEALAKCHENNEIYGDLFGDHHVISRGKTFHDVTDEFLKNYKHFGKRYHTVKGTPVKYTEKLDLLLKDMLLSMCKTRKQRRIMKAKFLKEDVIDLFRRAKK